MKLLIDFDLKDYDSKWPVSERPSARGIILTEDNKIALVYSKRDNYYKFPGGGIESGENKIDALIREVKEETGLVVIPDTIKEYGYVCRRQKSNYLKDTIFLQNSYYYTCKVEETVSSQNLDKYEEEAEFELRFVDIKTAIETNKKYCKEQFSVVMMAREILVLEMILGVESTPSVAMAELLLEKSYEMNPGPWKAHSYAVAEGAKKIALALAKNGISIDPDKAYVYGLLHDIGRREGTTYMRHVYDGYKYFSTMNFKKTAQICLTHSFNLHVIDDYIGKVDVSEKEYSEIKSLLEQAEYDDYDRMIQLLDSTCGADGTKNLEARMTDVKNRYGMYPQGKWDKNFELKEYFEKLMKAEYYSVLE